MVEDAGVRAAKAAFTQAVVRQADDDLAAWAAAGRSGLIVLRDFLTGAYNPSWPGVHARDEIDGVAAAVSAIAAAHPDDFLDTFDDDAFRNSLDVLIGLGWIDRPAATARLLDAAGGADPWVRQRAIIGLGRRTEAEAEAALIRATGDPEYLVRCHALMGLTVTGTAAALATLRGHQGEREYERELAATAVAQIEGRAAAPQPRPPSTDSER